MLTNNSLYRNGFDIKFLHPEDTYFCFYNTKEHCILHKKKIKAAKTNILRVQLYTLTQRTTAISQKELLLGLRSEYYEQSHYNM